MSCCINPIRRSRKGIVFGVCQGIADHYQLSVVWLRLAFILVTTLATFGFPAGPIAYLVLAFVMKPGETRDEPKEEPAPTASNPYEDTPYTGSVSLRSLKDRAEAIEARIRRMENHVTNKSYDWERRFRADQ